MTRAPARDWRAPAILGLMMMVGAAVQSLVTPIDADVSWLITVSERVLAGERLYLDVFEVNPPASVWLYLPQVWLAHALGLRPEAVIAALTLVAGAASALITERQLGQLSPPMPRLPWTAVLGFVCLVLPGGLFAQREHYALLLALPVVAVMARLASGERPALRTLLLAGAAGGLVAVIKPHFLFALVLPGIYCAWAGKAWRATLTAAASGTIVVMAYAIAIALFAGPYLAAVPMLAEVYGPMRQGFFALASGVSVLVPMALAGLALVIAPRPPRPHLVTLLLMMAGFTVAVLIQGKGYWNHALPAIGLGLVAIATAALDRRDGHDRRMLGLTVLVILSSGLLYTTLIILPPPGLVAALQRNAPPNPTMIGLTTELSHGHPAVRLVDGRWVGTRAGLFTAAGVRFRTANWTRPASPALRAWYDEDLSLFARDVALHRPDVVLVERESVPWLFKESVITTAMRDYRPVAQVGKVAIWVRRGAKPSGD